MIHRGQLVRPFIRRSSLTSFYKLFTFKPLVALGLSHISPPVYGGKAWKNRDKPPREKVVLLFTHPFVGRTLIVHFVRFCFFGFIDKRLLSFFASFLFAFVAFFRFWDNHLVTRGQAPFVIVRFLLVTGSPAFLSLPIDKTHSLCQLFGWLCHSCRPVLCTQLTKEFSFELTRSLFNSRSVRPI